MVKPRDKIRKKQRKRRERIIEKMAVKTARHLIQKGRHGKKKKKSKRPTNRKRAGKPPTHKRPHKQPPRQFNQLPVGKKVKSRQKAPLEDVIPENESSRGKKKKKQTIQKTRGAIHQPRAYTKESQLTEALVKLVSLDSKKNILMGIPKFLPPQFHNAYRMLASGKINAEVLQFIKQWLVLHGQHKVAAIADKIEGGFTRDLLGLEKIQIEATSGKGKKVQPLMKRFGDIEKRASTEMATISKGGLGQTLPVYIRDIIGFTGREVQKYGTIVRNTLVQLDRHVKQRNVTPHEGMLRRHSKAPANRVRPQQVAPPLTLRGPVENTDRVLDLVKAGQLKPGMNYVQLPRFTQVEMRAYQKLIALRKKIAISEHPQNEREVTIYRTLAPINNQYAYERMLVDRTLRHESHVNQLLAMR